jgi:hypothetical protein
MRLPKSLLTFFKICKDVFGTDWQAAVPRCTQQLRPTSVSLIAIVVHDWPLKQV